MSSDVRQQLVLDLCCHDAAVAFGDGESLSLPDPFAPRSCTTAELLGQLLSPVTVDHCQRLLEAHERKLRVLARATLPELRQMGLTARQAEKVLAVIELATRFGEEEWVIGAPFRGSYDVYAHFRERLAAAAVEYFFIVLLDNKNRKLKEVLVSKGSLSSSVVHPRDVFLPVIRESAAAMLMVHNHPSGCCTPSPEDIEITRRLREVGDLVGVRVLDHIIIGKGKYTSFVDDGYW